MIRRQAEPRAVSLEPRYEALSTRQRIGGCRRGNDMPTDVEEPEEAPVVPYVSEQVKTAVVTLQSAVRGLTAYPAGHTIPASLLERAYKMIKQAAAEQEGTLDLVIKAATLQANDCRFRDKLRAPQRLTDTLVDRGLRALIFREDLSIDAVFAAAAVLATDADVLYDEGGAALILLEAAQFGVVAIPMTRPLESEPDADEQRWDALTVDVAKGLVSSGMASDEAKGLLDAAQSPEAAALLAEAAQRVCGDNTNADHLTELLVQLAKALADPDVTAEAVTELVQSFLEQCPGEESEQVAALLSDPAILAVLSSIGVQAANKLAKVLEALSDTSEADEEDEALLVGNQAALLRRLLEEETDPWEYRTLLDALVDAFPEQVVRGHFGEALASVQMLRAHADGEAPDGAARDADAALERMATRYVLELILRTLAERTSTQDARVLCDIVVEMGPPAVPGLAGLLEEAEQEGLRDIVDMLRGIGTPEAIDVLVAELLSAELDRGRCIVEAIRQRPEPASTAVLVAGLRHQRAELRQAAAFALGQLGDAAAIAGLGRIARRRGIFRRNAAVRREAVRALGGFRDSAAADELANVALGRHLWPWQRDISVRIAAVRALAQHASPKAREYLALIAQRCKRAVAAEAWRALGGRQHVRKAASDATAVTQRHPAGATADTKASARETTVASAERG